MTDYDRNGGDSLTDVGFFTAVFLAFAAAMALLYWVAPGFARWLM